jgi:hypothetical protein
MLVADNLKPKTENTNRVNHAWLDYSASSAGNSLDYQFMQPIVQAAANSLVHD